jgi:putative FmdB family regulatory protein
VPIYEYFCSRCKIEFELMRPFSEFDKPAKCHKCNVVAQKLVSSFGSKTGSSMQASSKPFRAGVTERVKQTKKSQKTRKGETRHRA